MREILLSLSRLASFESTESMPYQVDPPFPALLNGEYERLLQTSGGVGKRKECLVWPLRRLSIDRGEEQLQGVGSTQGNGLGQ